MPIENTTPGNPEETNTSLPRETQTGDVTELFTWAKLEGSKYRDFSGLRARNKIEARTRPDGEATAPLSEGLLTAPSVASDAAPLREAAMPALPTAKAVSARFRSRGEGPHMRRVPEEHAGRRPVATTFSGRSRTQAAGPRSMPPVAPREAQATEHEALTRRGGFWQPFDTENESHTSVERAGGASLPAVAFVSLAGGVGKTSLVASVGCMLAAQGVSSLLVDTHAYGLLPLFFGARELSPGTSRTFASRGTRAPVRVMTLNHAMEDAHVVSLMDQIAPHTEGMSLVLLDVSTGSLDALREVAEIFPTVLVVMKPDMASVVSLQTIEALFSVVQEDTEHAPEMYFVLNQFDESLRLHRDVRERLKRQLGRRLLPFVLHESRLVSDALAECMTIVDYAPDSQIVEDLDSLSRWIREPEAPSAVGLPDLRWRGR